MIVNTPNTRGQLFAGGLVFAFASAFLVGGLAMAIGVDVLVAATYGLTSFFVVGLIGWTAELLLGPSLEQVALEREGGRAAAERVGMPAGGAAVAIPPALAGGDNAPLVIPPTFYLPPPGGRPALMGGLPGPLYATMAPQRANGVAGGAKGARLDVTLPAESIVPPPMAAYAPPSAPPSAPPAAIPMALPAPAPDDEFQDLASLLREVPSRAPAAR